MKKNKNILSSSVAGKTVFITGGYGTIGKAIVSAFIENGAKVFVGDLLKNKPNGGIFARKYIKHIELDISSEKSIRDAFGVFSSKGKTGLDVFINSAYPRTSDWGLKLEEIPFRSFNKNLTDHLGGYCFTSKIAAEIMKKNGRGGVIINFASIYGVVAPDFSIYEGVPGGMTMPAAYAAIKGGIITFTKYLATYYGKYNIRANCISPGGVFNNQHPVFVKNYSKKVPLGKMAAPRDIAGGVLFLASEAASYITGHNLIIDGGFTAW